MCTRCIERGVDIVFVYGLYQLSQPSIGREEPPIIANRSAHPFHLEEELSFPSLFFLLLTFGVLVAAYACSHVKNKICRSLKWMLKGYL